MEIESVKSIGAQACSESNVTSKPNKKLSRKRKSNKDEWMTTKAKRARDGGLE